MRSFDCDMYSPPLNQYSEILGFGPWGFYIRAGGLVIGGRDDEGTRAERPDPILVLGPIFDNASSYVRYLEFLGEPTVLLQPDRTSSPPRQLVPSPAGSFDAQPA